MAFSKISDKYILYLNYLLLFPIYIYEIMVFDCDNTLLNYVA